VFTVQPANVAELGRGDPERVVRENALRKARAVWAEASTTGAGVVIGCDTIVTLGGEIYGKPADLEQAAQTLMALSGARHEVLSGLAVLVGGESDAGADEAVQNADEAVQERVALARTTVSFRELDGALLAWYLATGEWCGRAGAYAIQGAGAALVREVAGDYENVVGLPVAVLLDVYPELLSAHR
jgi:nucleoside triphosphate pyrophosphatase